MNIDTQDYLSLVEDTNNICFWDIESTGFKGDYDSIIIVSVKPFHGDPVSFEISQPGNDQKVVREASAFLSQFMCWVTYYGKGFDFPMVNTRLLKWGLPALKSKHHIDLYYSLKCNLNTSRKSQAHLLEWLETPQEKMTVGADIWNRILYDFKKSMNIMRDRCESDAVNTQALYLRTKHLIKEIKKG